jgi:hypothetical protein
MTFIKSLLTALSVCWKKELCRKGVTHSLVPAILPRRSIAEARASERRRKPDRGGSSSPSSTLKTNYGSSPEINLSLFREAARRTVSEKTPNPNLQAPKNIQATGTQNWIFGPWCFSGAWALGDWGF